MSEPGIVAFAPRQSQTVKAIGYIRVSTEEQAQEGLSLRAQAEQFERYCQLFGLEPFAVVWDERSAKDTRRPGYQLLMQLARERQAEAVVIYKLDRMFRNTIDALEGAGQLDRAGVALHSITEKLDTRSATGRFFFTLLASLAELERAQIAERTREAMRYKRDRREYCGGKIPYGFTLEEQGERRLLVELDDEMKVVERIRRLRAEGYRGKPMSYKAIAKLLLRERVPTKNGRDWHGSTIRYICENPLYAAVDKLQQAATGQ